jgi:hypothetical protein
VNSWQTVGKLQMTLSFGDSNDTRLTAHARRSFHGRVGRLRAVSVSELDYPYPQPDTGFQKLSIRRQAERMVAAAVPGAPYTCAKPTRGVPGT